jgi:hypothetical protein
MVVAIIEYGGGWNEERVVGRFSVGCAPEFEGSDGIIG